MRSSLMMSLLRILTPEEINELTTTSDGNKRVPLTQLMYLKMGVETSGELETTSLAKILPFTFPDSAAENDKDKVDKLDDDALSLEVVSEESSLGPASTGQQNEKVEKEDISSGDEKMQTSVFILHEKERLAENVHKMRSKDLMKSYKKNASLDIEQERGLRDDMNKSSRSGVLINKKHA